MLGGSICFKHLEQMRIADLQKLHLEEIYDAEDRIKKYKEFCASLDKDLERMTAEIKSKGIEIGHVLSSGKNPKTFYYIVETEKNLRRARRMLNV